MSDTVVKVLTDWDTGGASLADVLSRLLMLLTPTNINTVVSELPTGLGLEFVTCLKNLSADSSPMITFGGPPIPEYFELQVRPAIQIWVREKI